MDIILNSMNSLLLLLLLLYYDDDDDDQVMMMMVMMIHVMSTLPRISPTVSDVNNKNKMENKRQNLDFQTALSL